MIKNQDFRFAVAPMMDWTDRHCRFFHRLLSKRARLYTEMVTSAAIIHGQRQRLLQFDVSEHPVALQLGGANAHDLAKAAQIGEDFGYDEINLNVGCPSDRVQNGAFGAALMREPQLVGDCVDAMKAAVKIPVTIKCRLGVDDQEPSRALWQMTESCLRAGVDGLIVHARKAWLQGLSPKENRDIPPLDYELVHQLKLSFPHLLIALNGGLTGLPQMVDELDHVDGVMVGRAAYQEPALLLNVDPVLFGEPAPYPNAQSVIAAFIPYIEVQLAEGLALHTMTRHILGLFNGQRGARAFRRHLATEAVKSAADVKVLVQACRLVEQNLNCDETLPAL
jgi:tRNA-dihydrouridine synthase A